MKIQRDPLHQLDLWYRAACRAGQTQPEAVTLVTATRQGKPSARVVLYKGLVDEALFFVTNYQSRKGREIAANPSVAIVFVWLELERQVRVEGRAILATSAQSDAYWKSRPRESQLSALASKQSRPIPSFKSFATEVRALEKKFRGRPIPRPKNWGGYRIVPDTIEFWQGRAHRRHERTEYSRRAGKWTMRLLSP